MTSRAVSRIGGALAIGLLLGGCATKGSDGSTHFVQCHGDEDCSSDELCSDEQCVPRASAHQDSAASTSNRCTVVNGLTSLTEPPVHGSPGGGFGEVISDGQYVYFVGIGAIYRVNEHGGPPETVYSGSFYDALGTVIGAANGTVAWVSSDANREPTGIAAANSTGIHVLTLSDAGAPTPAAGATAPVVDAQGNVYVRFSTPVGNGQTWKWNPDTDTLQELRSVGTPGGDGYVSPHWVDRGQMLWLDGSGGFITDVNADTVRQLFDASTSGIASMIGFDQTNVYGFGQNTCGAPGPCTFTVLAVPRAGGTPFTAYESGTAYHLVSARVDDSGLYWLDSLTRNITHAAMHPGASADTVVQIADNAAGGSTIPARFAMDACNLYWVITDAQGDTRVMAYPK